MSEIEKFYRIRRDVKTYFIQQFSFSDNVNVFHIRSRQNIKKTEQMEKKEEEETERKKGRKKCQNISSNIKAFTQVFEKKIFVDRPEQGFGKKSGGKA